MGRKIKVFLGAYINQSNAQNLNCRTLAQSLDKDKYQIYTLSIKHGNLGKTQIPGVKIFNCFYPVKVTQYFGYFWGIYLADIAYLPRGNDFELQRFFIKLFKRKSFKTVENIIDKESLSTALSVLGSIERVRQNYSFTSRLYSITSFMKEYNFRNHGIRTSDVILPPLIDTTFFSQIADVRKHLKHVVFLGNDMKRKKVDDYLKISKAFPQITFHIIGRDRDNFLSKILRSNTFENIAYHGLLTHDEMLKVLKKVDLHILTSRSEGFPKGIIECASAGIPSLVYHDYGAEEWIDTGKNGFVHKTTEEMIKSVQSLINGSQSIELISSGALNLADTFSIKHVTESYAREIDSLYNE